jgi:DNA-directed RNA polymerase subunit F
MATLHVSTCSIEKLPDFEIEQFWYELKNNMHTFLDNDYQIEINTLSSKFNLLQKEGKYAEIEKIIAINVKKICFHVMKKKNWYKLIHTYEHIKKWDKISDSKISDMNENLFTILSIINYLVAKNITPADTMLNILSLYPQNTHQPHVIYVPLFRLAIEHNMVGIIDRLRHTIDITPFVHTISDKQLKTISSAKLMKYLKSDKENTEAQ